MARTDRPRRLFLFDYGNVICTSPTPEDWDLMSEASGLAAPQDHTSVYWQHRAAYDAGRLTPVEYWSLVCGEHIAGARAAWLDALDANQWSHPNLDTLDVLEDLDARGERLALLSNMPAPMVSHLTLAPWTRFFPHRFFSSSLGLIKPSPEIFHVVLADLGVQPAEVTFIDDSPRNIDAALSLGIDARLFDPAADLSRELGRPAPSANIPLMADLAGVAPQV